MCQHTENEYADATESVVWQMQSKIEICIILRLNVEENV